MSQEITNVKKIIAFTEKQSTTQEDRNEIISLVHATFGSQLNQVKGVITQKVLDIPVVVEVPAEVVEPAVEAPKRRGRKPADKTVGGKRWFQSN